MISRLEKLFPLMHWIVMVLQQLFHKMAFGNALGVKIEHNLDPRDFFAPGFGDIIMEVPADKVGRAFHHIHTDR